MIAQRIAHTHVPHFWHVVKRSFAQDFNTASFDAPLPLWTRTSQRGQASGVATYQEPLFSVEVGSQFAIFLKSGINRFESSPQPTSKPPK